VNRWDVVEALIKGNLWTRGAELGVFKGETFFHLLDACPTLTLIGVDRWERTVGPKQDRETGFASYADHPMEAYASEVSMRAVRYGSRAVIIRGDTVMAARSIADVSLDFVFVDASHDTESVKADVRSWRPKIRGGGLLIGHDINWPSVRRALTQLGMDWAEHQANIWYHRP